MGGTQHLVKKDGTPQNGGYWGVPKAYSFQMGGTSTPHSGRATVHPYVSQLIVPGKMFHLVLRNIVYG